MFMFCNKFVDFVDCVDCKTYLLYLIDLSLVCNGYFLVFI